MSRSDEFEKARSLYGTGEAGVERLFPDEALSGRAPWPDASRLIHRYPYDRELVRKELTGPVKLRDIDPVQLHRTQGGVTRDGVHYYMSGEYDRSGATYADQGNAGNRFPLVYERPSHLPGQPPQRLILSGHHRAVRALLQGRQFRARYIEGGWGEAR